MLSADLATARLRAASAGGEVAQTGLVSDPAGLNSLSKAARAGDQAGLESAARAFESLLVGQMLKQMRAVSLGDGIFDSEQTKLYQDLYDQQAASILSQGEGLGIRKALLRQLGAQTSSTDSSNERDPADLKLPERDPMLRSIGRRIVDATGSEAAQVKTQAANAASSALKNLQIEGQGQWPPSNAQEFLAYLKPYADQAAEQLGMDTSILLAQSALETGWGKHVPRGANGESSFNLFGIKADRSWNGDKVSVGTLEYRGGVARREQAKFRAYASPAECFVDYVAFLRRNPRYGDALKATSPEAFIRGLQKAGYATDPSYANKVLSILGRMEQMGASMTGATQVSSAAADNPAEG